MIFIPYYFFFLVTLFIGSLISISSSNWLYVWIGLEINLLSFIPLVICGLNELEAESSLKYFLVQALGSRLILLGSFSILNYPNSIISLYISSFFLISRIIVKIGIFPFHYWLPHVIGGLSWVSCILLAVWQKFAPIMIIRSCVKLSRSWLLLLLGGLGSLIGGLGGLNQTQLRVLLAYSSIGHIGWIVVAILSSFSTLFYYYLIYSFITLRIIGILIYIPRKRVRLRNFSIFPLYIILIISILFISLGGLPPFLGFYPKWIVLITRDFHGLYLFIFILIIGSLINIFYYLNIFFNLFLKSVVLGFNNIYINYNLYRVFFISLFFIIRSFTMGVFYII